MANGIPFDTTMMTAAHPTAKLDSKLVVFSPDSKRAFEVMVTDRGPSDSMQKKGRGIDLSARAFDSLGGVRCPSLKTVVIYDCPILN